MPCGYIFALFLCHAVAADEFQPNEHISLDDCWPSFAGLMLAQCTAEQIRTCEDAANLREDGYHSSRMCAAEAAVQADELLNVHYFQFLHVAQNADVTLAGSAYANNEEGLRKSQRTWIELRDATCVLRPNLGAINSGYDTLVDECQAVLTMQRIGFLNSEIYP